MRQSLSDAFSSAREAAFALVPTGNPPSLRSGTLMSLRAIPSSLAG